MTEIILYTLAGMWAVGADGAVVYLIFDSFNSLVFRTFSALILIPLWAICGLGPIALIHHKNGPILATLLKSEWQCTSSHKEQSTSFVASGNVMIPITSTNDVCDSFGRR